MKRTKLILARGRPKAAAGEAITKAIIAAATKVFLVDGFEEASMEVIAARAGVTKVTLYKRFPDKRSVLQAVLLERRLQWSPPKPTSTDLEERLKHYAASILVWATSAEFRAFNNLAASAWKAPKEMTIRKDVLGYNDMLQQLEHEISNCDRGCGFSSKSPRSVAVALLAIFTGWFEHRVPDPDHDEVDAVKFAHKAVELLIHGTGAW